MGAVAPGCPHCTLVPRLLVDLGPAPPQPSSAPPASPLPGGEPAEEDEEEEVPELGDGEGRAGGRGVLPPSCSARCPWQVTLLSFAVESDHTFLDYIRGG